MNGRLKIRFSRILQYNLRNCIIFGVDSNRNPENTSHDENTQNLERVPACCGTASLFLCGTPGARSAAPPAS